MTNEEKIIALKQKLNNNDLELNEEETLLISLCPDLWADFSTAINNSTNLDYSKFYNLLDSIVVDTSRINDKEVCKDLICDYVRSYIQYGYYVSDISEEVAVSFGIDDPDFINKIRGIVNEELHNPKNKFDMFYADRDMIINLLDAKRYDVIGNLNISFDSLEEDVIERMIAECPQKGAWENLKYYQIKNNLYEFDENDSLETLAYAYNKYSGSRSSIDYSDKLALIKDLARKKIEEAEDLSDLSETLVSEMFSALNDDPMFKYRNKTEAKILFDKNCIYTGPTLVLFGTITKEELASKMDEFIDQGKDISTTCFDRVTDNIYENPKYIDYLVKNGDLLYLLNKSKAAGDENLFREIIPKIINEIENDNPHYEELLSRFDYNISNYPELGKAIIKKGKLERIELSYYGATPDIIDTIVEASKKKGFQVDTTFNYDIVEELATKLLSNDCIGTLCSSNLVYATIYDDLELAESKINNIAYANNLLENSLVTLANEPRLLHKILQNPLLVDKALELIAHNEEVVEKAFNNDTFEIVKAHLVEKYNLNEDHLTKMNDQLGSMILKYIENENIQEILALPDAEFDKILALFPKEEYTMTDIEAGYESLIQKSYGKENVEDINIFASMKHAIEDKDIDRIIELRTKLVSGTKRDFLESIMEKYNLNNVHNTGNLIDLIIRKSKTPEESKYLDILHDITDEYIANSRIEYRNNHYFDSKYPQYSKLNEKIIKLIGENDSEKLSEIIYDISGSLDKQFYEKLGKEMFLPDELKDPKTLLKYVVCKVKERNSRDDFLPILKTITDYHHDKMRDKCSREIAIGEELKLNYTYEEKSKKNAIIKHIITHSDQYVDKDGNFLVNKIYGELVRNGFDKELIMDCIRYYGGEKPCYKELSLVQEKMNTFVGVSNRVVRKEPYYNFGRTPINEDELAGEIDEDFSIKRQYYVSKLKSNPYRVLSCLNLDLVRENILSNEEMYQKLEEIMHKKKLHLLPDYYGPLLEKCGISSDLSNIAAFINFFPTIIETERRKLVAAGKSPDDALNGLSSILSNADTYSSVSSVYSQILGDKDAKLIKANEGPNEARLKTKNNERLNEAVQFTKNNFTRREVTIPTFDEKVEIESPRGKKSLEAVVGNFTDPCNLTHGERTGACMRIGGVGETLFRFCLTNKNGFHIRFEDPDTHEYVSRVSGFRNGNTVFLNELRYSCHPESYSDADVVDACTEVARRLIEKSKDSTCPIENVVIAKQYALESTDDKVVQFDIKNNKEGLPKFYSDIGTSGVVLATTAKDGPITKIDLDNSRVPSYETCRGRVCLSSDQTELFGKINRVASIKTLLTGVPLEDIDSMDFPDGILCGMYSDDWYIYVDENKEIHYDVIEEDKRAKMEVTENLERIDELIRKTEIENEMRGEERYGTR